MSLCVRNIEINDEICELVHRSKHFRLRHSGPQDVSRPRDNSPSKRKWVLSEYFNEVLHHRGYYIDQYNQMYDGDGDEKAEVLFKNYNAPAWKWNSDWKKKSLQRKQCIRFLKGTQIQT